MSPESKEGAKKLVSVFATSMPAIEPREEAVETIEAAGKNGEGSKAEYPENFARVLYIWYLITFRKKSVLILALFNLGNEVNVIYPTFARELGLPIKLIDVRAQKIDSTTLDTSGMIVSAFPLIDKANWVRLFEETFLMANISLEVVFKMLFPTLSGIDIDFSGRELR